MTPILHWKKSKAEAQLVAGFQSSVLTRNSIRQHGLVRSRIFSHGVVMRRRGFFRVTCIAVQADGLRSAIHLSNLEGLEVTMAKGQLRSNREKKKPKHDKNKKKGAEASSPLAGMHSQVKLGTSYSSQYGKKH